jgi:hypothetical protein
MERVFDDKDPMLRRCFEGDKTHTETAALTKEILIRRDVNRVG